VWTAVLEFEDLHDVVLVGHSMSGVVVPRVAEAFPGRIRKVVWMAAVVLNDGETITEAVPVPSPAVQRSFVLEPDGTIRTDPALGRLSNYLKLGIPSGYRPPAEMRCSPPSWRARLPRGCPARNSPRLAGHDLMITRPAETAAALVAVS
jgi:pimeloyl-ACP methyl ester carboxylesterase